MNLITELTGKTMSLIEELERISADSQFKSALVLIADETPYDRETLNQYFQGYSLNVFGGIFPQLIYGGKAMDFGAVILPLKQESYSHYVKDGQEIESISLKNDTKSIFVFFDGLFRENDKIIEEIYLNLGNQYNYIGGGAGSLSFESKPCVISNKGILTNEAVIVETSKLSSVGVAHGWEEIGPSLRVKSDGRYLLKKLDYKNAFDVYKEILEEHAGKKITEDNFFEIAKFHPFGIYKPGGEIVVRDPILLEGGDIVSIGVIPDESFVRVLSGDNQKLIDAAYKAKKICDTDFKGSSDGFSFVVDCISRVLSLGEQFEAEARAFADSEMPVLGILSLGEIANMGSEYLEIYNKTVVVSKIED